MNESRPLYLTPDDDDTDATHIHDTNGRGRATVYEGAQGRAFAKRIVACVNELDGIANPSAVSVLLATVRAQVGNLTPARLNEMGDWRRAALAEALAELDATI